MSQALRTKFKTKGKAKRTSRLGKAAVVAGSVAALTAGLAGSANAAILNPITIDKVWQAAPTQEMFQPLFDYDSDSCFPAAAVESNGRLNGGLQDTGSITGGCRTNHLGKANTYSRAKCDKGSGWCGIIYTLYFEKDQNAPGNVVGGHRHEWWSLPWSGTTARTSGPATCPSPPTATTPPSGSTTWSAWASASRSSTTRTAA
ncbi:NPP1 family protein [Streptomyces caeruleatus]|uniref:NPP1 family protein n=1 Tax=Streptomyces caeruleatus TaxID=661399 RepID=UPI0024467B3F|nr:NPP1 family protein [Streptomyces caeruleatus]